MRHLLSLTSVEEIDDLWLLVRDIEQNLPQYAHVCDGKKLATLYEPSTRTRLSFEAAAVEPGRQCIRFFIRQSQFRCQGRKRCRYHPHDFRYSDMCHVSSKGRRQTQ